MCLARDLLWRAMTKRVIFLVVSTVLRGGAGWWFFQREAPERVDIEIADAEATSPISGLHQGLSANWATIPVHYRLRSPKASGIFRAFFVPAHRGIGVRRLTRRLIN